MKKIHYYCELFTSVLGGDARGPLRVRPRCPPRARAREPHRRAGSGRPLVSWKSSKISKMYQNVQVQIQPVQ